MIFDRSTVSVSILATILATGLAGCATGVASVAAAVDTDRPRKWAERIALDGVPNLHRIAPGLYRSAQPTAVGMKNLESLGIRTVINLRFFNTDEDVARDTNLQLKHVQILTWHITDEHVIDVMRELRRTENGPFLIHCHHGADRTGLMSALYRVLEQDWSTTDALDELVNGGYGFHPIWRNIPRYLRNVHRDQLRDTLASTPEHPRVQPELREPDNGGTGEIVRKKVRTARLLAN